jgi:hypothetical protein
MTYPSTHEERVESYVEDLEEIIDAGIEDIIHRIMDTDQAEYLKWYREMVIERINMVLQDRFIIKKRRVVE